MNAPRADDSYDLIVIGGGISGLAVTRRAANKGMKVLMIERAEIGAATSNNSLRIIHGGFRYLQNLAIPRVLSSLKDQARVLAEFPDLVRMLPCYLPLQRFGLKAALPLNCARLLYRGLGLSVGVTVPSSAILSMRESIDRLSILEGHVPYGAFLWTDLQLVAPELLHSRLEAQASSAGASFKLHSPVTHIQDLGNEHLVTCVTQGKELKVRSKVVVNCAGPWVNSLAPNSAQPSFPGIGWCRAFNLVFKGNRYGTFGFALAASEGRQYFIVGRDDEIAVGTEYLSFRGDPAQAQLTQREIVSFIDHFQGCVPELSFSTNSLLRTELGVLPINLSKKRPEHSLVGSSQIVTKRAFISLLSTKYTTFLGQADQVVEAVGRALRA
jgi:glycerol-3-phosphate dehydrogenase